MAILVDVRSGRSLTLPALCLLGRSSICTVRVEDNRVSGEHARLFWQGDRWHLRDLGSRNGTFVNDRKLERGGTVALDSADRIALGDTAVAFSLLDASAPVAQARQLATGQILLAEGGILALPSADDPAVTVFQDADRGWVIEADGEARAASDGDAVDVRGRSYVLHLPAAVAPTVDARDEPADVREVSLRLRVSRDEERVELTIACRKELFVLPPRSHHYTLLLLARARKRDEDRGSLPDASKGWIPVDDLCRMLATDENKLNVDMFRIRKDLGALAVASSAAIIERRRGSREVRLGTSRVAIETD